MARRPAEWMTALDERVLEALAEAGWDTPAAVARRLSLPVSVARLRERCRMLAQAGLVAPLSSACRHYDLTGAGRRYLAGDLDARDQPRPSPTNR